MKLTQNRRGPADSGSQSARETARAQVKWPARALFLSAVAWGSTVLVFVTFPMLHGAVQPTSPSGTSLHKVTVAWGVAILVANSVIAVGAVHLYRLKSRALAYWGAVLALIPLVSPCYIVGPPLAIWVLIVMRRPDVVGAFESATVARR